MPELTSEARLAAVFVTLVESLRSGRELLDCLDVLVQACTAHTGAAQAAVILRSDEETYRAVASTHERTLDVEEAQLGLDGGPCIEAIRLGRSLTVPDISAVHDRWPEFTITALEAGLGGALALPLEVDGETVGGVNVFLAEPGELGPSDVALLTSMLRVIAIGLSLRNEIDQRAVVAEQLNFALESRVVLEQAKGALSYEHDITVSDAFQLLRRHARTMRLPLREVAQGVIERRLRIHPPRGT